MKAVEARRVASVREVMPAYDGVGKPFAELGAYAERHGVSEGEWISVWYDAEFKEENVDGEAAFATDEPLPMDERVRERELPAVESMACTVHHGPFATIGAAYGALLGWIEANGYRVTGPNRELYLGGGDLGGSDSVTELQFPVEKAE
jgi:effector-binding domain-containing protein